MSAHGTVDFTTPLLLGMRFAAALLCVLTLASAQTNTGTLTGTVTDPDGKGVPTAPVQAKNVATGTIYKTAAVAKGDYISLETTRRNVRHHGSADRVLVSEVRAEGRLNPDCENGARRYPAGLERKPGDAGRRFLALDPPKDQGFTFWAGAAGTRWQARFLGRLDRESGGCGKILDLLPWADEITKERRARGASGNPGESLLAGRHPAYIALHL